MSGHEHDSSGGGGGGGDEDALVEGSRPVLGVLALVILMIPDLFMSAFDIGDYSAVN